MKKYTVYQLRDGYLLDVDNTLVELGKDGLPHGAEEKPEDFTTTLQAVSIDDLPKEVSAEVLKIVYWKYPVKGAK